jgi:hypothetical protein
MTALPHSIPCDTTRSQASTSQRLSMTSAAAGTPAAPGRPQGGASRLPGRWPRAAGGSRRQQRDLRCPRSQPPALKDPLPPWLVGWLVQVPGDGRELVAADPAAVKIRAEDGRRVEGVDISPFISNLPYGKDTRCFSTPDASGSTSQVGLLNGG